MRASMSLKTLSWRFSNTTAMCLELVQGLPSGPVVMRAPTSVGVMIVE